MKYIAHPAVLAMGIAAALFSGCDGYVDFKDVVMVTGTETNPVVKFAVETTPATYSVTATATTIPTADLNVTFAVDLSKLDTYNKLYTTTYQPMPEGSFELMNSNAVIEAGKNTSTPVTVKIKSLAGLSDVVTYIIPVTITNVSGGMEVLEASNTIYLKVARVLDFTALDIAATSSNDNSGNGYETFYFSKGLSVDQYTFEVKFFVDSWHTGSINISRLLNWGPGDNNPQGRTASSSHLLRFGEGGYDLNQLQWLTSHGPIASNTRFDLKRWYTLSFTYDGIGYKLFVDGKLDNTMDGSGKTYFFDALEIGMSWKENTSSTHRYQQRFQGRISEIRFWDRPLKAAEIASNLCGVPSNSTGLVAYWRLNEGSGYLYHDCTGNGRDIQGHYTGDGSNPARGSFNWVSDSYNKCAQ